METFAGTYKNMSASGVVKASPGIIIGVVINSHTSGTLKFWDNPTAGATTVIYNTITLAVGERYINLCNANFTLGCYLTIGGTADVTVIYK